MKPVSLVIITALSVFLIGAPVTSQAKAQQKDSRQVVVNDSKSNNGSKASNHRGSNKNTSHRANNHKGNAKSHGNKNRSHGKNKQHNNNKHVYNNGHRSKKHHGHRRHRSNNIAKALLFGAAVHHTFGRHGSHHNGHPWCPTHHIYHSHHHGYNYNYSTNVHYNAPYRVDTFVELAEGRCYKVIEYSNGDERRKRIRDHHCDELDEFEEWDDWDEQQ